MTSNGWIALILFLVPILFIYWTHKLKGAYAARYSSALRESETRLQVLSKSIPQIVWTLRPDGHIDWYNSRWFEYTGLTLEETRDEGWRTILHPDDLQDSFAQWTRSFQSECDYKVEYRLKRASDNSYRWHLGQAVPVRDSKGNIVQWLGTSTDIHDQKLDRDAAIASKQRVDAVIANVDAVIFSIEPSGVFTFSEGRGLSNIQLKPGERVGQSIYVIYEKNLEVLQAFEQALKGNQTRIIAEVQGIFFETHFNPLIDLSGKTTGVVGVALNIHDRVMAHRELEESRKKLYLVLDHAPIALWALDRDKKFLFREGIGIEPLGYETYDIVGRSALDIYRNSPHALNNLHRAYAGESVDSVDPIGDRWYHVFITPVRDALGEITGVTGFTTDITDRKRIQLERSALELREQTAVFSSKMKSEFLAHMSHEIRTPINGIIGMTDLTLGTSLTLEQREYLDTVNRSADALLIIVNDILDFSKIEAGKMELETIDFNLLELLEDIEKTHVLSAKKKYIGFFTRIDRSRSWALRGDPGRLRQVLTNLVNNAIKFTAKGQVSVDITSVEFGTDLHRIHFKVSDTGIGITDEELKRTFQAFSQAEASTTRRFGGTGLGLSISKRLVELMGGEIGVTSTPGAGSTFWFEIELHSGTAYAVARPIDPMLKPAALKPHDEKTRHILVAEDNSVNQLVAVRTLERLGYQASTVANGREALEALQKKSYDLVLMDCQMPEMDGYEATRRIRALDSKALQELPIIAMTANAIQGEREKCLAAGMSDYVSKPVNRAELDRILRFWLNRPAQNPIALLPHSYS